MLKQRIPQVFTLSHSLNVPKEKHKKIPVKQMLYRDFLNDSAERQGTINF